MKNWTNKIEENTMKFNAALSELSEMDLNWKPNAETWSIAQNLIHLMTVNTSYFPVFKQVVTGEYRTNWLGKVGFIVRFMGKTILKSVQENRKKKMKTFPVWEPSIGNESIDILKKFNHHQNKLKEAILKVQDKGDMVIASPANKNIVYTIDIAIEIIVTHELRHFNQIKEIMELMKKSGK